MNRLRRIICAVFHRSHHVYLLRTPEPTCIACLLAGAPWKGGLGGHSKRWYKCALSPIGGPATDIRMRWPACDKWKTP